MSAFRDKIQEFAGSDAQVLGISIDSLDTLKKFADSLTLPFPLVADADGAVAKAYGVASPQGFAQRVTFVIGKDGKVVKVVEGRDAIDPTAALDACKSPGK